MEQKELQYAYWLDNIEGIGHKSILKLLEYFITPEGVYNAPKAGIEKVISNTMAEHLVASKQHWNLEVKYEQLEKLNVKFYPYWAEAFPQKLRDIPDMPYGIYVKGELPDPAKKSIAIVGTRECTNYGSYVAEQFGKTLAKQGVQIISGMARGIDSISQQAALEQGGKSFAVLGSGVEVCYPASSFPLYRSLIKKGGVISTYLPMTQAKSHLFPPRNRIISGLSDAILVVEGSMKSGTLITVSMALEQGKDVYVVPGRIVDKTSQGCNYLIKQGATSVVSPDDLLEEMGIEKVKMVEQKVTVDLSELEVKIYTILDTNPKTVEEIRAAIGNIEIGSLMENLFKLCGKNMAKCMDGITYTKNWASVG